MKTKRFEELLVWQKAPQLVLEIYKFTERFPNHEIYGLTSQLRRAALSIPANIAEGYKKTGFRDKIRFYNISQASLEESRYYMILSRDLKYGHNEKILDLITEVGKLIHAYSAGVNKKLS